MSKAKTPPPVLPDQSSREQIQTELERNLLVEAAAGTGKTTSMTGRMVELVRTGICEINTIAAVTFTRKAASELRTRFQEKLEEVSRSAEDEDKVRLQHALASIDQCFIGTIHSYCARLLRERPVEAGIDPGFEEIDSDEDDELRGEAWTLYAAQLIAEDASLVTELQRYGIFLSDMKNGFATFANYPEVTDWQEKEQTVREADFEKYRDAVEKYITRLEKEIQPTMPPASSFGTCTLLPRYSTLLRARMRYDLKQIPQFLELLRSLEGSAKVTQKYWINKATDTTSEAEKAKKQLAKAESERWDSFVRTTLKPALACGRRLLYPATIQAFREAKERYDLIRTKRGILNFQDLLLTTATMLRTSPHVRNYFRKRFSHLLIDEFQDTDPVQAEVMLLLTADDPDETDWRKCKPVPGSLFVVGDPKQSIYRFRRADIQTYNEVKDIICTTGGEVVCLSTNFRTTPDIINWVNDVFTSEKGFPESVSLESPAYVALEPGRADGKKGELHGIHVLSTPSSFTTRDDIQEYEADFLARTVGEWINQKKTVTCGKEAEPRPVTPGDFMIVHYNTKALSAYGQALQQYGIPYQVTGGTLLNDVWELKLLHIYFRATVEVNNPVALLAVMRSELFGISDRALYAYKQVGGEFTYRAVIPETLDEKTKAMITPCFSFLRATASDLHRLPPVAAIERTCMKLGLPVLAAHREGGDMEAGSLAKAIEILRSQQASSWSAAQVVNHLRLLLDHTITHDGISATSTDGDQVRLMNLHKVKGLEAPIVFLAAPMGKPATPYPPHVHISRSESGIDGYLPYVTTSGTFNNSVTAHSEPAGWEAASAKEAMFLAAEHIRLQYVAATRAGSCLVISQREKDNKRNYWSFFEESLSEAPLLPEPTLKTPAEPVARDIKTSELKMQIRKLADSLAASREPTYEVSAAKSFALSEEGRESIGTGSINFEDIASRSQTFDAHEEGAEWGTVIHHLLELTMKERPDNRMMKSYAEELVCEHGFDISTASDAISMLANVTGSALWQKASASEEIFTEVPFQILQSDLNLKNGESALPAVMRGVIDLVYRSETGGWVVVDYKTDQIKQDSLAGSIETYAPQLRLYARAWERCCSGAVVEEAGIIYVRNGEYCPVDLAE